MAATYQLGDVLLVTLRPQEGLKLPSLVRTEKLATVEKSAVVRVLGRLSVRDRNAVEAKLAMVFREIVPF